MKNITFSVFVFLFCINIISAITVDGFFFLEDQTDHSGTKILFSAFSPSAITDSTFTNADGSFNANIEWGIYNVKGQKVKQFSDIRNKISVNWDGKDESGKELSTGTYFIEMKADGKNYKSKMTLVK